MMPDLGVPNEQIILAAQETLYMVLRVTNHRVDYRSYFGSHFSTDQ